MLCISYRFSFFLMILLPPRSTLFPYTTLFRSESSRSLTMRIIDADGHVLERDIPWADLIDAPYRSRAPRAVQDNRSEEHTSELQSHSDLVCRLLLEKKKKKAK